MASQSHQLPLTFTVTRQEPELVAPVKSTPREIKYLSDIDDQDSLRFHFPIIYLYRNESCSTEVKDPVKVIREALAKALVFYYPFAGRLREISGQKLVVDCTGEGLLFIEADADVTLRHFGDQPRPPFPCLDQLLYDVPGSADILNCPVLLVQVTRLRCGGFILAIRVNHTMCDAFGLVQFMKAVAEFARGAEAPTLYPVWEREFFNARDPPRVTCTHLEYEDVPEDPNTTLIPLDSLIHRSFFFGPAEVANLRNSLPPHLLKCSTIEVITACIWRCRTIAIGFRPDEDVRIFLAINARCRRRFNPPVPRGYYGNAFCFPAAKTTAGKLCNSPLSYAVELVGGIKSKFNEEYIKSVADLMVLKGRRRFTAAGSFIISDNTRTGIQETDFGVGDKQAVFAGPADEIPGVATFVLPYKNGSLTPICLPPYAMETFVKEHENACCLTNSGGPI